MNGTGSETLTAALRRLADEHASGLLSVATPGQDVVLELADGAPVGIGPTHDVGDRVGRDAAPELVAAAVVDDLVDRTVAAIVGGGGEWAWDVGSDASLMPVPPGLAVELSRRAVDAAQALAELDPEMVLLPAREFEVTGEVGRMQELFDGERSLAEVAELAGITVPALATHAAALVRAGVLSTGIEPPATTSWSDTVAGTAVDDDEDEPEPWVMDPPDPLPVEEEPDVEEPVAAEPDVVEEPGVEVELDLEEPVAEAEPATAWEQAPAGATDPTSTDPTPTEAAESEAAATEATSAAADVAEDEDWADGTWLDDLDGATDDGSPVLADGEQPRDARAALSAMLTDLQGPEDARRTARTPAATPGTAPAPRPEPTADDEDTTEQEQPAAGGRRKEPRAEPAEVAEFLRELSRLALDDD